MGNKYVNPFFKALGNYKVGSGRVDTTSPFVDAALAQGVSTDVARERHIADVTARKKAAIDSAYAEQERERNLRILGGESPEVVEKEREASAQYENMTGAERFQNLLKGGYDPEYYRALKEKSPYEVGLLYGDEAGSIAQNLQISRLQNTSNVLSDQGEAGSVIGTVSQGLGRGLSQLGNIVLSLGQLAVDDGSTALEDFAKREQGITEFWDEFNSSRQNYKKQADASIKALAEDARIDEEMSLIQQGVEREEARRQAAKLADTIDYYGNNTTSEDIWSGVGEQLPQLAAAIYSGGLAAGGSKVVTATASKALTGTVKKSAIKKAGAIGASLGIGAEAGAQDGLSAASEAYADIMQMSKEELQSAPNYVALINQGKSHEEAKKELAMSAAKRAGIASGLYTFGSASTIGSFGERILGGFTKGSTKGGALMGLSSLATEPTSEFGEEYVNIAAPKEAVNTALGEDKYADPTIYAKTGATRAAAIAGAFGGAASVKTSGSLVKHGASAAIDALKNTKLGQKVAEKFSKSAEREEDVSEAASAFEAFHKEDSSEEIATSSLIKSMIKKYAADNNMKEEDLSTKDYENFSKVVRATYEKAKADGNTEEAQRFEDYFRDVRKAAFDDLAKIYSELEVRDGKTLSKLIDEFQAPDTTDERKAELHGVIANTITTYERAANVAQVLQSNFMRNFSEDRQASLEDDNINLEDFLGKNTENLSDILFSADKIKDVMDANPEKASAIFKKWVSTTVGTISQDDVTAAILHDIKAPVMDMLKQLKRADLSQNAYTKASIQAIQKIFRDIPENLNDKTAKTIYGKWLDPNKGVLAYLDRLGKTDNAFTRLNQFRKTQADKVNALSNMIFEQSNNVDKNGQYLTPQTVTLPDGELLKRQDSDLPVEFNSVKEANAYLNKILHEEDAFNKIMRDVTTTLARAAKKDDAKAKSKSKAKPKQDNTTSKDSSESFSEEDILNGKTTEEKTEPRGEESKTAPEKESKPEEKVKEEPKAKESEENFEEVKEESEPIITENKKETKADEQSLTESTEEVEEKTETTAEDKTEETTAKSRQDEQETTSKEQTKETPKTEEKVEPNIYRNSKGEVDIMASKNRSPVLSNFAKFSFKFRGLQFDSIEEAYQVFKSNSQSEEELQARYEELQAKLAKLTFRKLADGTEVLSGKPKLSGLDPNTNLNLMKELLDIRFKNDEVFRNALLSTGKAKLVHGNGTAIEKAFTDILTALRDGITKPSKETKTESKESKAEPSKDAAQDVINKFNRVGIKVNNVTFNGKDEGDSIYKGAIWSGGAKGADRVWAAMLNETGVGNRRIYHFNLNNKDSLDNVIGTNLGLIPDYSLVASIRNALAKRIAQGGENFNNKRFIDKVERHLKDLENALAIQDKRTREKEVFKKALTARNILQVLWSNGVVAAAPATGKIQSGTMTAIILATYANLPVLILDTNSQDGNSWYSIKSYNYNNGNDYYNMEKVSDPTTFFDDFIKNGRSGDGLTFVGSRNSLMNAPNIRSSMVDYIAKTFNGDAKAIDEAFARTMINDGLMSENSEVPSTDETISDHANVAPVDNVTSRERADFRQDTKDAFFDAIKDKSKEEQQKIIAAAVTNGYFPEGDSVFSRYMNKSMNQYENVSKILDGSEDITEEMKADALVEFNPALSKEAAIQYVKDSPKEVDEIFEKIKSVLDIVQDRYAKGKLNIDEKTIVNPSAVLDLYGKDDNGNVVMPKQFMIALALGFIDAINHGLAGNAEMSDDFRENVRLDNKSTYNNKYNPVVLNRADGKGVVRPDERAFKDNELNSADLPSLGIPKNTYLNQLASFMAKRVGLRFSKDIPIDIKHGTMNAFAVELYSLLQNKFLLREYEVKTGSGNYMSTKVTFSGALPLDMPMQFARAFQQYVYNIKYPNGKFTIFNPEIHGKVSKQNKETGKTEFAYNSIEKVMKRFVDFNHGEENVAPFTAVSDTVELTNNKLFEDILNPEWKETKGYAVVRAGEESPFRGAYNPDVRNVPEKLREARERQAHVPFKINMDNYALFKANPDLFFKLHGGKNAEEYQNVTKQKTEQIYSKASQLTQQMNVINDILKEAEDKGIPLEEITLYFNNKVIANQRLMQASPFNPQNNKVLRELFQPVQEPISVEELEAMSKDGMVELAEGMVMPTEAVKQYLEDWHEGINLTDDRNIDKHIKDIALVLRGDIHKGTVTPVDAQTRNLRNLFGGMAQALGIKVEREAPHVAMYKLAKLLRTPLIKDMIELQRAALKGEVPTETYEKTTKEFADKYGNDVARAFAGVRAVTQYLYQPNGKFDSYLFYETDGVTNGTSNYTAQNGVHTDITKAVGIFEGQFLNQRISNLMNKGVSVSDLTREEFSVLIGGMPEALRERNSIIEAYLDVTPEILDEMIERNKVADHKQGIVFKDEFKNSIYAPTTKINYGEMPTIAALPSQSKIIDLFDNDGIKIGQARVSTGSLVKDVYQQIAASITDAVTTSFFDNMVDDEATKPFIQEVNFRLQNGSFPLGLGTKVGNIDNFDVFADLIESEPSSPEYADFTSSILNRLRWTLFTFPQLSVRQPDTRMYFRQSDGSVKSYAPIDFINMTVNELVRLDYNAFEPEAVTRSIAKSPSQPLVYGGGKEGIMNQMYNDWSSAIVNLVDKVYRLRSNEETAASDESKDASLLLLSLQFSAGVKSFDQTKFGNKYYMSNLTDKIIRDSYTKVYDNLGALTVAASMAVYDPLIQTRKVMSVQSDTLLKMAYINFHKGLEAYKRERAEKNGWDESNIEYNSLPDKKTFESILEKAYIEAGLPTAASNKAAKGVSYFYENNLTGDTTKLVTDSGNVMPTTSVNIASKSSLFAGYYENSFKLYEAFEAYHKLGAKVLTNTIVSREALVQDKVAQVFKTLGINFLNVYDGLDALWKYAKAFSELTNQAYFKVHDESNITQEHFLKLNYSSIMNNKLPALSEDNMELLEDLYDEFKDKTFLHSGDGYAKLNEVLYSEEFVKRIKPMEIEPSEFLAFVYYDKYSEVNAGILSQDKIKEYSKGGKVTLTPREVLSLMNTHLSSSIFEEKSRYNGTYNLVATDSFSDKALVSKNALNSLQSEIADMRNLSITKDIIYKLWTNDFPVVISTFAGTGTGSAINFNKETVSNLMKINQEYEAYLKRIEEINAKATHPNDIVKPQSFRTFLLWNPNHSFSAKVEEYRTEAANKYPSIIEKHSFTEEKGGKSRFNNLGDALNSIDTSDWVVLGDFRRKLLRTFKPLVEKLGLNNLIITTDRNEFIKALQKAGKDTSNINLDVKGQFVEGVGIYFNGTNKALLHEVIHAVMKSALKRYFGADEASVAFRKANKSFVQKAQLLEVQVQAFAKFLRESSFLSDEVASVMHLSANEIATEVDKQVAVMALANKLTNPETSADEKYVAMQEILAYAFSEEGLIGKLALASAKSALTKNSVVGKIIKAVKDQLNKLRDVFARLWFGNDKIAAQDSLMPEMLATMHSLAEEANGEEVEESIISSLYSANKQNAADENEVYRYLNDLFKTFGQNNSVHKLNDTAASMDKVDFAMTGKLAQELRDKGYKLNPVQEHGLARLAGLYQVLFDHDKSFYTLATRILDDVMSADDVENIIPTQIIDVLNSRQSEGITAQTLALLSVIPEVALLENKAEESMDILPKIGAKIENILSGNTKAKESLLSQVRNLAETAVSYDYAAISDNLFKANVAREQFKDAEERKQIADTVENLTGSLPDGFASIINNFMSDWSIMALEGVQNIDTESIIGKALQNILENRIKDKGRIDAVGRLIRLFIQMRNDTKPFYRMRASFSALLEHVRERSRKSVANTIHAAFRQEGIKIHPGEDLAIANALLRTSAFKLFKGNVQDFSELMQNKSARVARLSQLKQDLINTLRNSGLDTSIANWVNWQTSGLADLQTKRIAKSITGLSHDILPNTRAIAALPIGKKYTGNRTYQSLVDDFLPIVEEMTALKALDNVDKVDIDSVIALTKYKAFGMLISQAKEIDNFGDKYDLRGTEGIVMNKRNHNQDMKVVRDGSEESLKLKKMGYRTLKTITWMGKEYAVLFTDANPLGRYQTGSFGFAAMSNKGTVLSNGEGLRSVATEVKSPDVNFFKTMQNVYTASMHNPNFYDTMNDYSHVKPLIGRAGYIYGYSLEVDSATVENTFQTSEEGISALGNLQGRYFEQEFTNKINAKNAEILKQEYMNTTRKSEWIILDGKVKPLSDKPVDVQYAEQLNDFYKRLPQQTRDALAEVGGMPVRKSEVDNIVGYNRIDVTNLFNGTSTLPKPVQEGIRAVLGAFGIDGKNIKYLKEAQDVFAGAVGYVKKIMLIRSIAVPVQNIISNTIHLINLGVPIKDIIRNTRIGIAESKRYTENRVKISELYVQLRDPNITQSKRNTLTVQIKQLSDFIKNSPINPLVEAGMFSNISSAAGYEQQGLDKDFTIRSRLKEKFGLTQFFEDYDASSFGKFMNNLLISEGSDTYAFMEKSLDYGDFVAKFVLYDFLTKQRGLKPQAALDIALEEFVNYSMNRGAGFDYANTMGLTWFFSYATGIQKVIWKMLRRKLLRTSAVYGLGELSGINVVPQSNPLEKSWDYATSPSNVLDGFESHYLHKVFSWF